jgi:hypothetical protein
MTDLEKLRADLDAAYAAVDAAVDAAYAAYLTALAAQEQETPNE